MYDTIPYYGYYQLSMSNTITGYFTLKKQWEGKKMYIVYPEEEVNEFNDIATI